VVLQKEKIKREFLKPQVLSQFRRAAARCFGGQPPLAAALGPERPLFLLIQKEGRAAARNAF